MRAALRAHVGEMPPAEQISLHGNEWLLVRSMREDVGDYLALLKAMPRPAERPLVSAIAGNIGIPRHAPRRRHEPRRVARVRARGDARLRAADVGQRRPARPPSSASCAPTVLGVLGVEGEDPEVIAGARRVAQQYMNDPSSVDAVIADRALPIAAINGDEALFNQVLEHLKTAPNAGDRRALPQPHPALPRSEAHRARRRLRLQRSGAQAGSARAWPRRCSSIPPRNRSAGTPRSRIGRC